MNHVRSNDPFLFPRLYILIYDSLEEIGRSYRKEGQAEHFRESRIAAHEHDLEQGQQTRGELASLDSSVIKLVVAVLHRIHADTESCRGDHVSGVPSKDLFHLDGGMEFRMIDQIIDEFFGALRYQIVHELHLAGGKRGTQGVPHLPPTIPAQGEHVFAEQRLDIIVQEGPMIREMFELFHRDISDQIRIAHEYSGSGEVHYPAVLSIREAIVQVQAPIGEAHHATEHFPA